MEIRLQAHYKENEKHYALNLFLFLPVKCHLPWNFYILDSPVI